MVATHVDISSRKRSGASRPPRSPPGTYKRIASQYQPLTEEGRATIQAQVDHIYCVFVDAVAENRGVSVETVLERHGRWPGFPWAAGRSRPGLVDGVSTLPALVSRLYQGELSMRAGAGAALETQNLNPSQEESMPITREQLAADAPELLTAIQAEGAAAETERVKGCLAAALPGYEDLARKLALDGKTTPDAGRRRHQAAERASIDAAASLEDGGIKPVVSRRGSRRPPPPKRSPRRPPKHPAQGRRSASPTAPPNYITTAKAKGRTLTAAQAVAQAMQEGVNHVESRHHQGLLGRRRHQPHSASSSSAPPTAKCSRPAAVGDALLGITATLASPPATPSTSSTRASST